MKKSTLVLVIVIVLVLLGGALWYQVRDERTVAPPRDVPIDTRYDNKIVYTTNTGLDPQPFMDHCRDEGGTFNSCGSICEPGAAFCAEICAYTCDLGGDAERDVPTDVQYLSDITLDSPQEGAPVASPLTVRGEARGPWYFEASFPVVLTDWDGRIIAEAPAQAQGSWMTEEFVPYTATLTFDSPYSESDPEFMQRGSLILQKANPSGLPENDAAHEITVRFEPAP